MFFIMKHSPVWILPIVTSNIINVATNGDKNEVNVIIVNVIIMIIIVVQNIPTNYVHTVLYAKAIRSIERDLRSAIVKKLQQLSIVYHNEMQSGRLQSKIMRDVEQIENLSAQIFITIISIILSIVVALGIVIFKSFTVFVFFCCNHTCGSTYYSCF